MVGFPSSVNLSGNTVQTGSAECFLGSSTSCQADSADQFLCMSLLGCNPLWVEEHPHSSFSLYRLYLPIKHRVLCTISETEMYLPHTWLYHHASGCCQGEEMSWHYQLGRTRISFCLHVPFSINHAAQGQDLIDMPWNNVHLCHYVHYPTSEYCGARLFTFSCI